ncbi:MAG: Maf family protein [Calditrichia bacterium]
MIKKLIPEIRRTILISASPRRKEILEGAGLKPEITPVQVDESWKSGEHAVDYSVRIAERKLISYLNNYDQFNQDLYIAADTIVSIDDQLLPKPSSPTNAYEMLQKLSGRKHEVITGVAFRWRNKQIIFHETTEVYFKSLTSREINAYIETGEPFDKAGSYGIQGYGRILIEKIEGCFFNVMGFPIHRFYTELLKMKENM